MPVQLPSLPATLTTLPSGAAATELIQQFRNSGTPNSAMHAEAIERHENRLNGAQKSIQALTAYLAGLSIPSFNQFVVDIVLAAGTTIIDSSVVSLPQAVGDRLTVFIQAAGPTALLTWDASIFKFAGTEFDSTSGTWTVFPFVARVDPTLLSLMWFCAGIPLTGQS